MGRGIHNDIFNQRLLRKEVVLGNALVDMYVNCGVFLKAQKVLEKLPIQDATSYNALIARYVKRGHGHEALESFWQEEAQQESPKQKGTSKDHPRIKKLTQHPGLRGRKKVQGNFPGGQKGENNQGNTGDHETIENFGSQEEEVQGSFSGDQEEEDLQRNLGDQEMLKNFGSQERETQGNFPSGQEGEDLRGDPDGQERRERQGSFLGSQEGEDPQKNPDGQKRSERVELFVQAVDARLQKCLVQLLEDATGDLGLTSDWKLVPEAINMIIKRHMRVDKLIVVDSSDTSDEESKEKSTSSKHKLEELVLDDLVKGIQELNLNLKAVKLEGLSSKGSTLESRPTPLNRGCMWCDSKEHECRDCDDFKEAYRKNIVFWKDNKIHLQATCEPLCLNYGRGGMKKLAEEIQHNVALVDVATYGLQVYSKIDAEDVKAYGDLWPYALTIAERGKVPRGKLSEASNSI
ncbi:hypothetical protein L7F22_000788 [Adiantum nelumboides]|nr:hypothetical protein [Adiantum nelumboides]